jgi:fructose-1,6-bisphosphatase/inositol monophosphatase family enzyme
MRDHEMDLKAVSDLPVPNCITATLEELPDEIDTDEVSLWIDPLDATGCFVRGQLEAVTILLGIAWRDRPVFGVIHHPLSYDTYWGGPLIGLVKNGQKLPKTTPPACQSMLSARYNKNRLQEQFLESLGLPVDRMAGAGRKAIDIIQGKHSAVCAPRATMRRWDTCAPEAVLYGAGACATDMSGTEYSYCPSSLPIIENGAIWTNDSILHSRII